MFLKPEQQLERCKRIVRQRVDPHIHPSIAQLVVESFDIPGAVSYTHLTLPTTSRV